MELKVGDKIKVIEKRNGYAGKVGIIYEVRGPGRIFKYAAYFGGNRWDWQPFRPKDIKRASIKGEQLMLFEI